MIISTHAPTQGATRAFSSAYIRAMDFNSRAHARRDEQNIPTVLEFLISTHAPTQGATVIRFACYRASKFQLTRPRKARLLSASLVIAPVNFNSRAHARRDSGARSIYTLFMSFQLTRPRKARHPLYLEIDTSKSFQLTRPRKARHPLYLEIDTSKSFQLTRPRKARPQKFADYKRIIAISTHAPTQGATWTQTLSPCAVGFQLTRPRKARPASSAASAGSPKFQLTRPRKARQLPSVQTSLSCNFNSRAHARRDDANSQSHQRNGISTHAPTQGATEKTRAEPGEKENFNSRAHARRDIRSPSCPAALCHFNSRAHARRD